MNDLFLALCGFTAAGVEATKPFIKRVFQVKDTANPLYVGSIKVFAVGVGTVGAVGMGVDITPAWLAVSDGVGYVFTGACASLGSEVTHRLLEMLESASKLVQNRAENTAKG